eukprot:CAMPEP_0113725206 /NCGR_PEP_ID=MMETSP0038_2-20120614/39589_1 /TAXON_ID=2898 /ORGANISM="Cryptomonas paramecium" /LENGTH=252 /DNA_ID=CAMNT_0000655359 /DNA_START=38 /DNA_END=793 /DNA_ORIENTATION=+ /assembly_acc=CAM_ASM_000170
MYLLQRLTGGAERTKDEIGGEPANGPNYVSFGFSMAQGRRPYMEDVVFASTNFLSDGKTCFFGVFDGHAGKRAALWARDNLPKNLHQEIENCRAVEEALTRAFLRTDGEFLDKAAREGLSDGCTVTTAFLSGIELYVANAGDSRTIICRGTNAVPMSLDHKPDRPSERRRIIQAGGHVTVIGCARVNGVLATSRGFGDRELKRYVSAEPEIQHRTLEKGDDFLVLASDGLWDVMTNSDVAVLLARESRDMRA